MIKRAWLLAIGALFALRPSPAEADGGPCPRCGAIHGAKDLPPRTPEDAGYPRCISPLAVSRDHGHRVGYYVGGGRAFGGRERNPAEGTWGWDTTGPFGVFPRTRLRWTRHDRYQGGGGTYATDRPK